MDRINAPDNVVKGDGIQIGFSWGKFMGYLASYNGQASVTVPYVGTNKTTVTNTGAINNGSMTCSNVYCHSDGTAVRRNCATSTLNTSLAWDGSSADPQGDTVKCNNCHGFRNGMANTMTSGKHLTHVKNLSMPCFYCHADTVQNNGSGVSVLSNKTNHVNAVYDVKGGGDWYGTPIIMDKNIASGTGTWNATTKNCTVICHNYSRNWTANDAGACPDPCVTDPSACQNIDPVQPIASCYNVAPHTYELIDRSYDPDYNDSVKAITRSGGHTTTTPGQLRINWWNKGNFFEYPLLTDKPQENKISRYTFSDTFMAANPDIIVRYTTFDNDPQSFNNYVAVPRRNGGWIFGAWTTCTNGTVSPTVNDNPVMDYTASIVNANTIQIIDRSLDYDYNDAAKNAANTCGNDGSTAQLRFQFIEDTGVVGVNVNKVLTDVPTPTTQTYTYKASTLVGSKTVWWTYAIRDNTYIKCTTAPSRYMQKAGWQSLTMP
ncbi:MAG: CxxxxCH/CxxCH domain-containing protein [Desulfobulbaceae bacterium]|nr:CxxxxCH/CxxCH domain-containing protein [Desulfobulbaceae bacterium]